MHVDYGFYLEHFGGMTAEEFARCKEAAEQAISALTFHNGQIFEDVEHEHLIKLAVCAAADALYDLSTSRKAVNAGIKSESNDGYSVTYADNSGREDLQCVSRVIRLYLLPTGWLSRRAVHCSDI